VTDQPKPDGQNGDVLAKLREKVAYQKANFQNVILTFEETELLFDLLDAPQPTRDGAEGAGEARHLAGEIADYFRHDYYGDQTRAIIERVITFLRSLTPPKPAPDAMRESERHAIAHARYQAEQATPEKPDCCFDYELVKDLLRVIDRIDICNALCRFDGAGEPVATAENAVYQKITGSGVDALENRKEQVATPPVRGDREAIARIITPLAFNDIHMPRDRARRLRGEAYEKADAILYLPVQPGAGERS
jgi:hypothetical protein